MKNTYIIKIILYQNEKGSTKNTNYKIYINKYWYLYKKCVYHVLDGYGC